MQGTSLVDSFQSFLRSAWKHESSRLPISKIRFVTALLASSVSDTLHDTISSSTVRVPESWYAGIRPGSYVHLVRAQHKTARKTMLMERNVEIAYDKVNYSYSLQACESSRQAAWLHLATFDFSYARPRGKQDEGVRSRFSL